MKKVPVGNNQTSWDIALQECGSIEAFFQVVDNNPTVFTGLNVALAAGQILKVDDVAMNSKVREYYSKGSLKVVNGLSASELGEIDFGADFSDDFNDDLNN